MRLNKSRSSSSETRTHNRLNITWISSGHLFPIRVCSWVSLAAEHSRSHSSFPNPLVHKLHRNFSFSRANMRARPCFLFQSRVERSCRGDPSRPLTPSLPPSPFLTASLASSSQLLRLSGSANTSELHCLGSHWSSTRSLGIFVCMSLFECGTVNGIKVSCFHGEPSIQNIRNLKQRHGVRSSELWH